MELTPKERAKELVDKYFENWNLSLTIENAKQCALIAVDEIIKELDNYNRNGGINLKILYFQLVKKEINNL
jgi:hypothetical protein